MKPLPGMRVSPPRMTVAGAMWIVSVLLGILDGESVLLHDYRGTVVASLTVAGPASRLTTRTLQSHLVPLHAARRRIESHLGVPDGPTDGDRPHLPLRY